MSSCGSSNDMMGGGTALPDVSTCRGNQGMVQL
jgi:hypothetical protein